MIKIGDRIADDGEDSEHRIWTVAEIIGDRVYAEATDDRTFKKIHLIPAREEVRKDAKWECVWNILEESSKKVVYSRNGLGVWSAKLEEINQSET